MDDSFLFSGDSILYLIVGAVAVLIMPFFRNKSLLIQSIILFAFCLIGSTFISAPANIYPWLFYMLFALCWTGLFLLQTIIDRIPLISYVLNSALLTILALAASSLFNMLPPSLFSLFLSALFIHLLIFWFMKKTNLLFEFFPIIFLMNWIIGYGFLFFAGQGHFLYFPIFFGYPLMEIGLILITRLFFKNKEPLFIVEQAFSRGAPVRAVIQKVFYTTLLLGLIGLAGIKASLTTSKYGLIVYGMAFIILYNMHLSLAHNMTKVTLRSTVHDIIMGFKTLLTVGQSWVEKAPEAVLKAEKQQSEKRVQQGQEKTAPKHVSKSAVKKKKSTRVRAKKLKK